MTYVNDTNLTLKAKAVMTAIINAGENFGNTVQDICALCGIGVYAARTAVIELETAGYLKRERERRCNGTLGKMQYVICATRNCKMKKTNTKIIVFPKAYVKYCNEKIYEEEKMCADGTVSTLIAAPMSDNLTLVENTQPNIGENGFIKPTSPMLGYPILDDKEKQEKEKRSKKEKEIKEINNTDRQTKSHVREEFLGFEQTSLFDEQQKTVSDKLYDIFMAQIEYERFYDDNELSKFFSGSSQLRSCLELVLQIMAKSFYADTTKIDGTVYDRKIIRERFLRVVGYDYVKGFLIHAAGKGMINNITTPLRYWTAAFFNYGVEMRRIGTPSLGVKAVAPMAESVPAPEQNVLIPEEQEQLQEEEQWLLSLPDNEFERELERKKDYYDVMYPEGSKVRARYNNLLAALYVHNATDHSFTDEEALLIYEWERRRLNAELRYRSDGWISQDLRSLYLQTNSKLGTNENSSRRVGYALPQIVQTAQKRPVW